VTSTPKAAVEYVVKGLASGAPRPVIDRTFKFDDMVEVHRYLGEQRPIRKDRRYLLS